MPQVEGAPKGLNEILHSAYTSALKQGKDKDSASAIAWAAAKEKYKKEGGNWVTKLYVDLAGLSKFALAPTFAGDSTFIKEIGNISVADFDSINKDVEKADIGEKPDAMDKNPISGFNYSPSADGTGRTSAGEEDANLNDRGMSRKIVDTVRNLQKLFGR